MPQRCCNTPAAANAAAAANFETPAAAVATFTYIVCRSPLLCKH